MKHQLEIECQARKRAEELYIEEMRKRVRMEKVIDKLQKERMQIQEQDASHPPSTPPVPSVHASSEVARQQDGEAGPTSTDTT